ncbi:MAG: acyl-CoA thioesterase YciA, partial [Halothiobacillaceae bacterium]
IGTTSITVEVEAYVERNRNPDEVVKVTQATLTYVAINDDRTPRPVPAV